MRHSIYHLGLLLVNLLIPISLLVFAKGFFPYKPFLPGLALYDDLDLGPAPEAPFNRLVFMVVDALRSDFVYAAGSGFEFTQQLIRNGDALPFTANARSPTVTMPRIKAMTTGSIPSFLDAILNFDEADTTATLAAQDTWLAQMKSKASGKLVMYGDDTWLKLFPDTFDRADGTSSFFVSDFTEVDNNVTRHIAGELARHDWSTMVLHYLGLDHIGHKAGPRSPNMLPKQREMDAIVKQLFESMAAEAHMDSALLVLCGDHGMNDAGNHGASSAGETSPALVFISPKLRQLGRTSDSPVAYAEDFQYYSSVEQSDIAPTLAALMGFPVPRNNLGALIPDFLPFWTRARDQARLLMNNARQILDIVSAAFDSFDHVVAHDPCTERDMSDIQKLACRWKDVEAGVAEDASSLSSTWLDLTSQWLKQGQDLMSNMASNYDMPQLVRGHVVIGVACVLAFSLSWLMCSGSLAPLLAMAVPYGVMMFASSYVEEEHQFWYWFSSAWLAYLAAKHLRTTRKWHTCLLIRFALALVATRIIKAWNQTGQKFAGGPDVVRTFIIAQPQLLWALVAVVHAWLFAELTLRHLGSGVLAACMILTVAATIAAAFSFKLIFAIEDAPELVVGPLWTLARLVDVGSLVQQSRIVFYGISLLLLGLLLRKPPAGTYIPRGQEATFHRSETLLYVYAVFAVTQSRLTNVPLFILYQLQFGFLSALDLSAAEIATSSLAMQYMSFFASGGTNSIASIDLSSAYNGISGFNVGAVGVLTFASNWAAAIYWTFATNLLLARKRAQTKHGGHVFSVHVALITLFAALAVGAVMAACTALRTHLFIWTVFSPKYLYCMAWSLGQHLVVNVILGGALYNLG